MTKPILLQLFLLLSFIASQASAENSSFADDFSKNTIQFGTNKWGRFLEPSGVAANDSNLTIKLVSEGPEGAGIALNILGASDSTEAEISLSSNSSSNGESTTLASIRGIFFNESPPNEVVDGEGDIRARLRIQNKPSGDVDISACLDKYIADGSREPYNIFEGEQSCKDFNVQGTLDTKYQMSIRLDRNRRVMIFTVDGNSLEAQIPGEVHDSANARKRVTAEVYDASGTSQVEIYSLKTDNVTEDFTNGKAPNVSRYKADSFDDYSTDTSRSKSIENGQLKLTAVATETNQNLTSQLRLANPTDYLEAQLMLASDTTIESGDGWAGLRIAGVYYSDVGAGSHSILAGDVWASLALGMEENSEPYAEYCVYRADAADFAADTQLLGSDNICPRFTTSIEFDNFYQASVQLDEEAKQLRFSIDDEVKTYDISTDIYARSEQSKRVQVRLTKLVGRISGFADNLRSDPAALTSEEQAALDNANNDGSTDSGGSGGGSGSPFLILIGLLFAVTRRR